MPKHLFSKAIWAFFILFSSSVFPQKNTSKLYQELKKLETDNTLQHGTLSLCVMPVLKDTIIAQYNSNASVIPASTLKIVTTAAALSILGKDFRFETKLQYDGLLDTTSGTLKGNLYITGGGDPTLESAYFKDKNDSLSTTDKWANYLKQKGIKKIEGAIIGDESIFEDNALPPQWVWADIGNYFGAGACGLSYADNKYRIYLKSEAVGTNTFIVKTEPQIEGLQLINTITAGGSGDNAFIYGAPYSYYRKLQGTIPANKNNYDIEGSLPDPALFCAQSLHKSLNSIGILVTQKATTVRQLKEFESYINRDKKTIFTNYSPSLSEIVYWTNLKSNNLYAEHLLKYIAYKEKGLGQTTEGTDIVTNYWQRKGIDVEGFFMNDGSGLSRSNVITTKTEAEILRYMAKDKNFKPFYDSFPVAGKSGSLGSLCEGTFAENNLRAKSGYITRARGYAGYVKNKKGELLCFSVLANNYECSASEMKKKLEKILVAIAEYE
ncbi:MAG: D-alanyl-D-alanine carboxypeptidase/D-alanyl-D-alanine-endopeptidase [Bacteroidia bacterium]